MAYVISDECISCGACAADCPVGAISEGDGKFVIDADTCIDCGLGSSISEFAFFTAERICGGKEHMRGLFPRIGCPCGQLQKIHAGPEGGFHHVMSLFGIIHSHGSKDSYTGCMDGAGQPYHHGNVDVIKARAAAIYREDEGKPIRKSHENPDIQKLYKDFLGEPLSERSHHLLHTRYFDKTLQ